MAFQPPTSVAEGGVVTVAADDASVVVAGTPTDPTLRTGTLDTIAGLHPPAADWSNNSHKITGLANGALASDAAAFGQIPAALPPSGLAGGVLDGSYPNPGLAAAVAGNGLAEAADVLSVNVDGSTLEINADALRIKALGVTAAQIAALTITDAQVAAANKDGTAGTPSLRTLGTTGSVACAGNDSRLTDSRAPNGAAGGVLDGTYPNPGLAAAVAGNGLAETADVLSVNVDGSTLEISADALRIKALGVTASQIAALTITDAQIAAANKDGTAGTPSLRTLGTTGSVACAGNDSRLTDSRAPNGAAGGDLNGTYPDPSVDGGLFGGVAWTTVTKTGDESVQNSTALQDDNDLFFATVNNAVYEISAVIIYGSPLGAGTPDINTAFGEDATDRGIIFCARYSTTDTLGSVAVASTNNNATAWGTAATDRVTLVSGGVKSAGGTFRFRWAQATSGNNPTIVRAGSLLRYRRIV